MKLRELLNVLNFKVSYKLKDRYTKQIIDMSKMNSRQRSKTLDRAIYLILNSSEQEKLEIFLF